MSIFQKMSETIIVTSLFAGISMMVLFAACVGIGQTQPPPDPSIEV